MMLFPLSRPRMAISVTNASLTLVTARRKWPIERSGLRVQHIEERPLPGGLIAPSASAPNVADVSALAKEVRALMASTGKTISTRPVALILPDLCARLALFRFDAWPSKPVEQEALLRFRFDKELNFGGSLRLVYRAYPATTGQRRDQTSGSAGRQVMAVAIRRDILDQYEAAFIEADCLPVQVELSSFCVFDRCRPFLERASRHTSVDAFFLHVVPGCFFFLACRNHSPVYLRLKSIRDSKRLHEECLATLQFYDDHVQTGVRTPNRLRSLFVIGDETGLASDVAESNEIRVQPLRWAHVGVIPNNTRPLDATREARAFPAMSGVRN
jgi:hypothetical protein